jgi:hypothetical protein
MLPAAAELNYAANDAAHIVTPALEQALYELAASSNWPEYVIKALSVQYDGENLILTYPPELTEEIDNLEYGTLNKMPNAVIRPFLSRSDAIIEHTLSSKILDDLMEMEEVF